MVVAVIIFLQLSFALQIHCFGTSSTRSILVFLESTFRFSLFEKLQKLRSENKINIFTQSQRLNKITHFLNNVDCFYHTWESESVEDLVSIYKPKKYKVEQTKIFIKPKLIDKLKHVYNKKIKNINELQRLNNIHSRWYSFYESVKLVSDYEKETGTKYDFIFNSRFDMSLFENILFTDLDKSKFYCGDWYRFYDKNNNIIDEKKIYRNKNIHTKKVEGYPENENGVSDFWFCSEKEVMVEFSQIYLELKKLVRIAGKSNHRIAMEKIKSIQMEDNLFKFLEFGQDYYLSRWIES